MRPAELLGRARNRAPVEWFGAIWNDRRLGPPLKAVVAVVGVLGALRTGLRNNQPVVGMYVFGAMVGLLYAMVAFGLILIYRANRIINFAQAELGAASAVMGVLLIKVHHWNYFAALAVSLASSLIAGMLIEVLIVRRFYRAPRLILSVATIGLALVFAACQILMPHWLGDPKLVDPTPPANPFTHMTARIGGIIFNANALVIVFAAVVIVVGLTLFFRFTDIGMAVRASAENADRAALLGIPVKRVSTVVWVIAALLSFVGVFLRIPVIGLPIGADIGPYVLLYSLAAAVIARMESFGVALVAGVLIGVLEQTLYVFSRDPSIASALILPILLVAMLTQRNRLSRGQDTGISTWSLAREYRPVPPELRSLPEIAWGRFVLGALVLAAVLGAPYLVNVGQQTLASVVVIYGIVAVSLVILTGWAGQISLGQWGFAGIGAFVAGGLASHMHADFFVALLAAGAAGAVAAIVIGLPALRIQGLYLAVTTLAFAIAVQVYLLSRNYFGKYLPSTTVTIERPLLYRRYSIAGPRAYYYLCLVFLVLALGSARALRRSRGGRTLIATRDNERGAQSYGMSVARARLAAFAISGFWAALAGGLFAYHQQALDTAAFDPAVSLLLLIIVVIGGLTSLPGALLGTAWIGFLKYGPIASPATQALASGVGVLFLLMIVPGGLAQLFYGARDGILRGIAARRGIVVPSLLADVLTDEEQVQPAAEEETALTRAAETVGERDEFEVLAR